MKTNKTKRVFQVRENTHIRIDKQAWQLFTQRGYSQVTMDDLAAELGISKRTLYETIDGKKPLLMRLVRARLQQADTRTAEIISVPGSAREKLQNLLNYALSELQQVQPVLLADIQRQVPALWADIEATRHRLIEERVGAVIREGIETGELRPDIDRQIMTQVLFHSLRGVIEGTMQQQNPLRFAELLKSTLHILYDGIQSQENRT
jgi:AcrR family transcriptional regulator